MSGTDTALAAICLGTCYAMSGTDTRSAAVCLRACYPMSGTGLRDGKVGWVPTFKAILALQSSLGMHAISLRACYTMSSTDLAFGATSLCGVRGRGGEEGTGACARRGDTPMVLRLWSYGYLDVRYSHTVGVRPWHRPTKLLCSTHLAFLVSSYEDGMQCPVLTMRMTLPGWRGDGQGETPIALRQRYAMSGADIGYAATR
eukprot:2258993-Rhodomonas_salina.5